MSDFVKSYLQDVGYQMSDLARDLIKSTSARLGGRRGLHNQMSDFRWFSVIQPERKYPVHTSPLSLGFQIRKLKYFHSGCK